MKQEICGACGIGLLESKIYMCETKYEGQSIEVPTHTRVCNYCTSELSGAEEFRKNKESYNKVVEQLMSTTKRLLTE